MAKRTKTNYQGVYTVEVGRTGGSASQTDKSFVIAYMKDGKLHEERVGREIKDGMTAKKAQLVRLKKVEGEEQTNREIREGRTATTWTFSNLFEEYRASAAARGVKALDQDVGRFNKYLKVAFGNKTPSEVVPLDVERVRFRTSSNC